MLDLDTMVRLLDDIWNWKPDARPERRRKTPNGIVFSWQWKQGVRAVQRLRHLQLHDALFADLRRRTYIPGTEEDLRLFLESVRTQAIEMNNLLPCVAAFRLSMSTTGRLALLTEDPKEKRDKRLKSDPDIKELEKKAEADEDEDENEGASATG